MRHRENNAVELLQLVPRREAQTIFPHRLFRLRKRIMDQLDADQLEKVKDSIRDIKESLECLTEFRNERDKNETGQLRE